MTPRLFVDLDLEAPPQEAIRLVGEEHHYLSRVLRLRPGDTVHLLCRRTPGTSAIMRVVKCDADSTEISLVSVVREEVPARPGVTLLQGMPKGDKLDLIVQKATELGVSRIVPVLCSRSVAWPDIARAKQRQARWQRIATCAAQQSRRPDLPEVAGVMHLRDALAEEAQHAGSLRVMLHVHEGERARGRSLRQVLPAVSPGRGDITFLVGPEGGFDAGEVAAATQAGFVTCGLGQRILRTETVALCALSIVAYLYDM